MLLSIRERSYTTRRLLRPTYPSYALLARLATRLEVPGWGRLCGCLKIFGAENDHRWQGAPQKVVRGKWHGYSMELNLADWSERQTYFLGRYHELPAQLLLRDALRPGDRVLDVGANIGMLSLYAASLVGLAGVVEAFEPNPSCCERIRAALARNFIKQVRLHQMGLSDAPGELTLKILENHTGMATFAEIPSSSDIRITEHVTVPVAVGDAVLAAEPPVALIKVDVEGFETRVLRGLKQVLERDRPIVITEVIPEWLQRAGSSFDELEGFMRGLGYRSCGLASKRRNLHHRLSLISFAGNALPPDVADVVWLPADGLFSTRLCA